MKIEPYELDDVDRELIEKVRKAIGYYHDGDPLSDFVDESDLAEAVDLLLEIIDSGAAV